MFQSNPATPLVDPVAPGLDAATEAVFNPNAVVPAARPYNPYDDDERLAKFYGQFERQALSGRQAYEQEWWRKLLYRSGRQWITLGRNGKWRDKNLARWVPKPVTNKVAETYSAINSVFATVDPSCLARPLGNNPIDILTAETATQLEEAIKGDHRMKRVWARANFWHIMLGNVFLHPWWDPDSSSHVITLPFYQCGTCRQNYPPEALGSGYCPTCGPLSAGLSEAMQPNGEPLRKEYGFGHGKTAVLSPFEVLVPDTYPEFEDSPGTIIQKWRNRWFYERRFGEEGMKQLTDISWTTSPDDHSMQLLRSLAMLPDLHDGRADQQVVGNEAGQEGTVERTFWHKPCDEFPDGLWMQVAGGGRGGGKPLRLDEQSKPQPLPYRTSTDKPLWPFVHLVYDRVEGRLWGETPVSLVLQKNDQINQLDSLMQMMATRTANPVWLHPKGSEVKQLTGEPGLVIKYNPLAGAGGTAKPERVEGANIPGSLPLMRRDLIMDIENLVGTFDIIKGAKPSGVEAFSALQLLVERSQSRFGPVLQERGEAHGHWYQIALELERTYGPPERTFAVMGPNATWTFQQFKQADLSGNVVFTVEDGSQVPKTNLGKRAAIDQLRQLGVIDFTNPHIQYRTLQVFGQADLNPELDVHVRMALQEQAEWEKWAAQVQFQQPMQWGPMGMQPAQQLVPDPMTGMPMAQQVPPQPTIPMPHARQVWNDDNVHASQHIRWANSDGVQRLLKMKPQLVPYLSEVIQVHLAGIQQAQMQAAMQAGPGTGDKNGGNPLQRSNRESGKDNASQPAA
jgi:hypothetical protein